MKFLEKKYIQYVRDRDWLKARYLAKLVKLWTSYCDEYIDDCPTMVSLALELAVSHNDINTTKYFLETEKRSDLHMIDLLYFSIESDSLEIFKLILEHKPDFRRLIRCNYSSIIRQRTDCEDGVLNAEECLFVAAQNGSINVFKYMVEELHVNIREYEDELIAEAERKYYYEISEYIRHRKIRNRRIGGTES